MTQSDFDRWEEELGLLVSRLVIPSLDCTVIVSPSEGDSHDFTVRVGKKGVDSIRHAIAEALPSLPPVEVFRDLVAFCVFSEIRNRLSTELRQGGIKWVREDWTDVR